MNTKSSLIPAALSSVLVVGLGLAGDAGAATPGLEQCAGVIKAG